MFCCCWPCHSAEDLCQEGLVRLQGVPGSVYSPEDRSSDPAKNKVFLQNAEKLIDALKLLKAASDKDYLLARSTLRNQLGQVKSEPLARLICEIFKDMLASAEMNEGTCVEKVRRLSNSYSVVF